MEIKQKKTHALKHSLKHSRCSKNEIKKIKKLNKQKF